MKVLAEIEKQVMKGLAFLENKMVRLVLIVLLVLYNSALNSTLNVEMAKLFGNSFVRLIILLVIVAIGLKDPLLAILLAIALVSTPRNEGFNLGPINSDNMQSQLDQAFEEKESFDNNLQEESNMEHEEGSHDEEDHEQDMESFDNMDSSSKNGGPSGYSSFNSQSESVGHLSQKKMLKAFIICLTHQKMEVQKDIIT